MNGCDEVCIVGYALNKKKLRKGGAIEETANEDNKELNIINETSLVTCYEDDKQKSDANATTKWKGGGLADILNDKADKKIKFVAVDFEKPLEEQPNFHIIIHKLTEDIRSQLFETNVKLNYLSKYLRAHPRTILVDPIEAVRHVISRSNVCIVLQNIISRYRPGAPCYHTQSDTLGGGPEHAKRIKINTMTAARSTSNEQQFPCPFGQPRYLIVEDISQIHSEFMSSGLSFPVICKPLEACGTPTSHSMVVAVDMNGLSMVSCPSVIQEYKDHNKFFYKVYVIDKDVMIYQRPSLPNLQALLRNQRSQADMKQPSNPYNGRSHSSLKSILFDSRFAYPKEEDFFDSPPEIPPSQLSPNSNESTKGVMLNGSEEYTRTRKPSAADLSETSASFHREQFEEIAAALRSEFGLTLFGFDCIIPTMNEKTADSCAACMRKYTTTIEIIDINFFPSYKEVEDFPRRLKDYLRHRAGI